MSRIIAREHILKILYQVDFHEDYTLDEVINIHLENCVKDKLSDDDIAFITNEVEGSRQHLEEIDEIIGHASKGWKLNRMSRLDLTILRLAVYEIKFATEIPTNVAINEAINLAKKYSGDHAPSFINGVLGNIVNK